MEYILITIRVILLIFSFYGYIQFINKKAGIKIEFSFIIIFSFIGSILYVAGILNILKEATFIVLIMGIVCGFISLKRRDNFKDIIVPGTIFFIVMTIFFIFRLYGSVYTHYDNFSHWGLICKIMLAENRLPNFQDSIIAFKSYPPGSACFIYYIVKILGINSEWINMFAQAIFGLGSSISLFAFAKKNNVVGNVLAVIIAMFLMCANIEFYDLLVDTLLPLVGLGGLLLCIYYKAELEKITWALLPVLIILCGIKNSGIFFVAVIVLYYFINIKKNRQAVRKILTVIMPPLLVNFLWKKHVELVFERGMSSKHTMSLQWYNEVIKGKNSEDFINICRKILNKTFSFSNQLFFIFIFIILLIILVKFVQKGKIGDMLKLNALAIGSYIFYQLGLLVMYLVSMPIREAIELREYDRYNFSIWIFVAGIVCVEVIWITNEIQTNLKGNAYSVVLGMLCVSALYMTGVPKLVYYKQQNLDGSVRQKYDEVLLGYDLPECASYIFLCKNRPDFIEYLTRYTLLTANVRAYTEEQLDEIEDKWRNYDFLIIYEDSIEIHKYVDKQFNMSEQKVINISQYLNANEKGE